MPIPKLLRTVQILKDYVNRLLGSNSKTAAAVLLHYNVAVPDAASADYDVVVADNFEVLYVIVQKQGGAGAASNTITVKKSATAITDVIDMNVADKAIKLVATIDDAQSALAETNTLRVSSAKSGGNAACLVTIIGRITA